MAGSDAAPAAKAAAAWQRPWLLALALVAATGIAYLPALRGGFIWDDDLHVTDNPNLRSLAGLGQIWFHLTAIKQYYPLVHSLFWLEYHLWGLNAAGYHAVNVALHALAAVLLWRVLAALRVPAGWLAAALFALHPIEVESVAWISEAKNVLSAAGYFGAALAYLHFLDSRPGPAARPGRAWYAAALLLFLMALLSKTVTCSLPAALLLAQWWRTGRLARKDLTPLLPFFALGAALGLLTAWMEHHTVGARGAEWSLNPFERCLVAGRALWFYAGKLAWPAGLTFSYPRWHLQVSAWWQWLFPLAAVAVGTALWLGRRRFGRGPFAGVCFFAMTLFPALGFVDVYPMRYSFVADHFQYLAGAGLLTLAAAGLARWLAPQALAGAALGLAALLGVLTWQQNQTYLNLDTLWRTTLDRNPDSFLAHIGLGTLLLREGKLEEGQAHLQQAAAIKPEDAMVWMDLCGLALAQGRLSEALEWGRKSVALDPDMISAHYNFAKALLRANRAEEAVPHFLKLLAARPDLPEARLDLGSAYSALGRWTEAARQFQQAAELRPGLAAARTGLAEALVQQGNPLAGLAEYQRALELQPTNCAVLNNLAWLLATCDDSRARDGARAVTLAERACRFTGFAEAQLVGTLAAAYAEAGRFPEAVATAEQAKTLATAARRPDLAQRNEELLQAYRQRKPYHAPARNRP